MGKPMLPKPMKPSGVVTGYSPSSLGERIPRDPEAVDRGRDSGVDADLEEDLADLLAGDAVGERTPDVGAQFLRPVEHGDHREVQHASGLQRQVRRDPTPRPSSTR